MVAEFFQKIGVKENPSRLFVGGLHGKEGLSTLHALESLTNISIPNGSLVLSNFSPSPYFSTLNPLYYQSLSGSKLLDLIIEYHPQIYLEIHCYHLDKKDKLVSKNRMDLFGVPALVELENGILMGSVSPLIRTVFFDLIDFPFILEMPCEATDESLDVVVKVMEIAAKSTNRFQIMDQLNRYYPIQIERLNQYFIDFSENFYRAFLKIKEITQKIDLESFEDMERLIEEFVDNRNYNLNQTQIKLLIQSYLIYREYGGD